jgi:hypothetical protein
MQPTSSFNVAISALAVALVALEICFKIPGAACINQKLCSSKKVWAEPYEIHA